jgi:LacI family transcriptional regulator
VDCDLILRWEESVMAKTRRIAILMGQDLGFCRDVIRGIRAYGLHKPEWSFRNGPPDVQIIPSLREWNPDGIIAELYSPDFAQRLLRMRTPVVDTACWLPGLKVRVVDVDHEAVGRLAAEYLLSLGLTNFAYFGSGTAEYSLARELAFSKRLIEARFRVIALYKEYLREAPTTTSWKRMESETCDWLRRLPKPVGIFVCNDVMARHLADLCSQLGLHVPDEVALLGVDNDELECLLTTPPLSSIAITGERIGYEAAKQLDQAMTRPKQPPKRILLPPVRVVARQSTDTMAIRDPIVRSALRYIQAHAAEPMTVSEVVRNAGAGRRELERKFRSMLDRSIREEIVRKHIQQAQRLLASTDLPMPAVAKRSGFSSAHRLTIVFHRTCGMPPTAYRRESQIHDS